MLVSGGVCGCVVLSFCVVYTSGETLVKPTAILICKSVVTFWQRNDRLMELPSSRFTPKFSSGELE